MTKIREGYKETEIGVIPEDWEVKELNKICVINPESLSAKESPDKEIKYIDIESVSTGRVGIPKVMRFEDSPSRARRKVKKEDVIVSTVRPYLKAFAPIESDEEDLICSTGFAVLRTNQSNYNYKFLFQTTISDYFINQLLTKMVGSNYPAVNSSDLANTLVTVPSLQEQQRIAEILSTTDSHIEKLDKTIEDYQLLKKGMMKKLLTEGIGHTEFKETEIGRIPKEWEVKELNRICKINPESLSAKEDSNKVIKYIDIESVSTGKISSIKEMKFSASPSRARRKVKKEDVIVSTVRPYLKAFAPVETEENDLICSTGFAVLRINQSIYNYKFLYQTTISDYFINQLLTKMVGSNYPAVNSGDLANTLVCVPPLQEQQQIGEVFSTMDNKIDKLQNQREDFMQLKKSLIEKLLTGKIRVELRSV